MRIRQVVAVSFLGSLLAFAAISCDGGDGGGTGGSGGGNEGGSGGTGGTGGSATPQWYSTCGDPVCGMATDDPNVPECTTEMEGAVCTQEGQLCERAADDCNSDLLCATSDPKAQGCPISQASHKDNIEYLPDAELQRVHDDLMTMRLATWRYKGQSQSSPEHFGFIIDDNPDSVSVTADGERVNLYGYTSMAVAALQMQDKQIKAMEQELKVLRQQVQALQNSTCTSSP